MRIRIRLLIVIVVILVFAVMLGAAGLAGRGMKPKLAVVQVSELQTDVVTYGLVDLDRGFFTQRTINVAGFGGANFNHFPPLVLQSTPNEDTTTWTLNALDVWSGALTPEMRIEAEPRDRFNVTGFRQQAGDRWIYRDFLTGKLYFTRAGEINGELLQDVLGNSTFWSNDFARFAVEAEGVISITNTETGATDVIIEGAGPVAVVWWSPDDRYIAVFSRIASDPTAQVIDVESRKIVAEFAGEGLRWCDDRFIYTTEIGTDVYEVRLYDLETGTVSALFTRDLSDFPVWERTLTVATVSGEPCDWLLVFTGRQTAAMETTQLVHVESSKTIPFGGRMIQLYTVVDGGVMYLVEDDRKTELRRIVLDPETDAYEVLASLDSLSTTLTWIDDARGAMYLRNGQLRRIDLDTGKEILLPGTEIQTFYVMP